MSDIFRPGLKALFWSGVVVGVGVILVLSVICYTVARLAGWV